MPPRVSKCRQVFKAKRPADASTDEWNPVYTFNPGGM